MIDLKCSCEASYLSSREVKVPSILAQVFLGSSVELTGTCQGLSKISKSVGVHELTFMPTHPRT